MTTGTLRFERVAPADLPALEDFSDHQVFQSPAWLEYLRRTQDAELVAAVLKDGNAVVGRLAGLIVRRFGMKIFGSPLPGWSAGYMGFNLSAGISRHDAVRALDRFSRKVLHCIHWELMDRHLQLDDIVGLGCAHRYMPNFEIDLTHSEEQLLDGMDSDRRRCIRKAARDGIRIEVATDLKFADEYYAQLVDVFARQSLVPTVTLQRIRTLLECLLPTGNLLLLRVREPDGSCIATGIFPAMNDTAHFWGGASWRRQNANRRNEAMHWHAMTYWRKRGMTKYDMGGGGEYKRKYGGREIRIPWIRKSRYPGLELLRETMRLQALWRQKRAGRGAHPDAPHGTSG